MPSYAKYLLRLEGALVAGLALWVYATYFGNWWLFAALILLPDLCLIVYLLNQKKSASAPIMSPTPIWCLRHWRRWAFYCRKIGCCRWQ